MGHGDTEMCGSARTGYGCSSLRTLCAFPACPLPPYRLRPEEHFANSKDLSQAVTLPHGLYEPVTPFKSQLPPAPVIAPLKMGIFASALSLSFSLSAQIKQNPNHFSGFRHRGCSRGGAGAVHDRAPAPSRPGPFEARERS